MALTRQEAINDALARLESTGFTMEPGFSEHGPMVAEAISALGRHDAVASWVEVYKAKRRHHPLPPPQGPIDGDRDDAWRGALGDAARLTDWLLYFRHALEARPWQEVIRLWVPRLIDGYAGGLTHGLIRTAHALRLFPEDGAPSASQRDELALGLAYWSGAYQASAPQIDDAVAQRPFLGRLQGIADIDEAISRHTATFAGLMLAHTELRPIPLIQFVHTITAPTATRQLLRYFSPDFAAHAYRCLWQVSVALAARLTRPSAAEAELALPEPVLDREELVDRAIAHGDEHVIKLTEACLREDRIRPDPVYRAAAEAILQRLPAWS